MSQSTERKWKPSIKVVRKQANKQRKFGWSTKENKQIKWKSIRYKVKIVDFLRKQASRCQELQRKQIKFFNYG